MTRGQRLLLAVLQRTTAAEVAARCGVAAPCVSRWLCGYTTPSDVPRARLAAIYRIPPAAWGPRPAVPIFAVRHPRNAKNRHARVTLTAAALSARGQTGIGYGGPVRA